MNPSRLFQIWILVLILFITMVNYLDRSAISYAILPLQTEFGLGDGAFGLIASGFGIGYIVMAFFGGILVEKYGSIRVWALSALLWSLATMANSLAEGFYSLLFFRVLLGLTEGFHFSALVKTVSDWLEPSLRARSIALGLFGVPATSMIGAPLVTFLMQEAGWRGMFFILGILGFIWAPIWLFSFRNRTNPHFSAHAKTPSLEVPHEHKIPWKQFLSLPFGVNCIVFFIFGYIVFFALIWLPSFFEKVHHASIQETGLLLIVPWGLSSLFILLGGFISDAIMRKSRSLYWSRAVPIGVGMLFSSLFFFLLPLSTTLMSQLWMVSLALASAFFINPAIYSLNPDLFPRHAGAAQGFCNCFFALAGFASPFITGQIVELSGSFDSAFLLAALLAAAAGIIALTLHRKTVV